MPSTLVKKLILIINKYFAGEDDLPFDTSIFDDNLFAAADKNTLSKKAITAHVISAVDIDEDHEIFDDLTKEINAFYKKAPVKDAKDVKDPKSKSTAIAQKKKKPSIVDDDDDDDSSSSKTKTKRSANSYSRFIKLITAIRKKDPDFNPLAELLVSPTDNFSKSSKSFNGKDTFQDLFDSQQISLKRLLQHVLAKRILDDDEDTDSFPPGNILCFGGIAWGCLGQEDRDAIDKLFAEISGIDLAPPKQKNKPVTVSAYATFTKAIKALGSGDFIFNDEINISDNFSKESKTKDFALEATADIQQKLPFNDLILTFKDKDPNISTVRLTSCIWGLLDDNDRKTVTDAFVA